MIVILTFVLKDIWNSIVECTLIPQRNTNQLYVIYQCAHLEKKAWQSWSTWAHFRFLVLVPVPFLVRVAQSLVYCVAFCWLFPFPLSLGHCIISSYLINVFFWLPLWVRVRDSVFNAICQLYRGCQFYW